MNVSPRTAYKKVKQMTPEELKKHKHDLYKRHYDNNKKKITEKINELYRTNPNYRQYKLISEMKFNNKLTDEEINVFNHCYQHIKDYTKNKRRYKAIIEKMINRKPLNQIRILTVE